MREEPTTPGGECFRCGYDLRGIADDQACPECGLLAARSRRETDELHHTRPRWLRSISRGTKLILAAPILFIVWLTVTTPIVDRSDMMIGQFGSEMTVDFHRTRNLAVSVVIGGLLTVALLPALGAILMTRPEGDEPADRRDRARRIGLRAAALMPLAATVPVCVISLGISFGAVTLWIILLMATVGCVPMVLLLFFHLRAIGRRARSAHLVEHCAIVAFGTAAVLILIPAVACLGIYGDQWFGPNWTNASKAWLGVLLGIQTAGFLFVLWSLYLFVRFTISFHLAARRMKRDWRRDDRARSEPSRA